MNLANMHSIEDIKGALGELLVPKGTSFQA